MDHMPWLLERSSANGGLEPCGHALMASCPPEPFSDLTLSIPFGHKHANAATNGNLHQGAFRKPITSPTANRNFSRHSLAPPAAGSVRNKDSSAPSAMDIDDAMAAPRTWELSKADLNTLLDLSQKLNLDGEITPIMAWGMVLGHPRLGELNEVDFRELSEGLRSKVRCYG